MKSSKPKIPPHVLSEMWQFMLKTSVPRILAEEQRRRAEAGEENNPDTKAKH